MRTFNEDTRVKIPATIQFLRLGYEYQSLSDIDLHTETRIEQSRLKKGLEIINDRSFTDDDLQAVIDDMYMEWERRKSIAMKENAELTSLRDWLLPMLMNGQVKVGGAV